MFTLIGSFICLMSLDYVESRWRPVTRSTTTQGYFNIPEDLDPAIFREMKIPNKAYCAEKYKKSFEQYLIMPWWYNYCEGLREKTLKKDDNRMIGYKYILKQLQKYRRNGGKVPVKIKSPTAKTKRI